MQKIIVRSLLTALVLVFAITPLAVFANEDETGDDSSTQTTTSEESGDQDAKKAALQARLEELKTKRKEAISQKLEAAKLRVCEKRKQKVANIMARAVTRAEKQLTVFDKIATRVEEFYVKKGRTIDNYDQLVAAVGAAKTQAQADVDVLKDQTIFDCTADDPKGNVEAFKEALKTVNQDLKGYRTAVKNLIVGVKSAQGTAASGQAEEGQQ